MIAKILVNASAEDAPVDIQGAIGLLSTMFPNERVGLLVIRGEQGEGKARFASNAAPGDLASALRQLLAMVEGVEANAAKGVQ